MGTNPFAAYRAAIQAAMGAVAFAMVTALTDNRVDGSESVGMVILGINAFMVYVMPNYPGAKYVKLITSAVLAGAGLLASWWAADMEITTSMWWQLGLAVAVALGLVSLPNTEEQPVPTTAESWGSTG